MPARAVRSPSPAAVHDGPWTALGSTRSVNGEPLIGCVLHRTSTS